MKLVELCGPSGVGKSATYREMLAIGGFVPNPKPAVAEAERVVRAAMPRHPDVAAFVELLDRIFATARGPMVGQRRGHTWRSLSKAVRCRDDRSDAAMAVDGGLVQRGQGIDRLQSDVDLGHYYGAMPAPDLVVMFHAPLAVIEARNRSRGGKHDRSADAWRSKTVYDIARSVFDVRGVRILSVDAERPAERNAHIILAAVKGLASASVA